MSQDSEDTRSLATFTLHTLICVITTILSLAGNFLVCLSFYRNRRLRTITNFYVLSLALMDMFMATFLYPFNTIASVLRDWPFGFYFCQFNGFLSYFWAVVSQGILALTAVNRYFCIVKPQFYPTLFTKKKTGFSIIFVCLFMFAVILATILFTPVVFRWHFQYLLCQVIISDEFPEDKALLVTHTILLFVVPTCVIVFCYGSVYRAIRRHNAAVIPSLQEANGQGTLSAHEIQASRVLLAAVIAFFMCWMPAAIINVLERVVQSNVPPFWQSLYTLSAGCSSWINPIIYGVMNRAMRNEFKKLLRCQKDN